LIALLKTNDLESHHKIKLADSFYKINIDS